MHLLEAFILIVLTLAADRGANMFRDIRRNNQSIRDRDEDLTTWIEDDKKQVRLETIRIHAAEARKAEGPDYSVSQIQGIKNQVLQRYRDQLRGPSGRCAMSSWPSRYTTAWSGGSPSARSPA